MAKSEDQKILDDRARKLAMPIAASTTGNTADLVSFSIGQEKYLIECSHVLEIAKLKDYTPVPGTPDFILGITNMRGTVLALVDLRKFLGMPVRGLTDLTRIIVLGWGQMEFGLLAQMAEQSLTLDLSLLLPAPDHVSSGTKKYIKGVTADATILLDAKALLQDERLTVDLPAS